MSYRHTEHSKFKRIWNKLNPTQKEKYIKDAGLEHIILNNKLNWDEIESNFQQKLRDEMRNSLS